MRWFRVCGIQDSQVNEDIAFQRYIALFDFKDVSYEVGIDLTYE